MTKRTLFFCSIVLFFIFLLTFASLAFSQQIKGDKFVSNLSKPSAERKAVCAEAKGCYVLTADELIKALQNAGRVAVLKQSQEQNRKSNSDFLVKEKTI